MTLMFENETIDHCLAAYQHHVDLRYRIVWPFRFAEVAFLEERSDPPPPPAMHFSLISASAFIKTCDTSVVLNYNV